EAGPDVEDVDQLVIEAGEAPGLIGADDAVAIIVLKTAIELDDTTDEARGEDADAAEVEKVETDGATVTIEAGAVVAEMGIAMDHRMAAKRPPPGLEHGAGQNIPLIEGVLLEAGEAAAFEPAHGQEAPRRQLVVDARHDDLGRTGEHILIEADGSRLVIIVELLAQPRGNLLGDLGGVDRRVHAAMEREQQLELAEIGLDRRGH